MKIKHFIHHTKSDVLTNCGLVDLVPGHDPYTGSSTHGECHLRGFLQCMEPGPIQYHEGREWHDWYRTSVKTISITARILDKLTTLLLLLTDLMLNDGSPPCPTYESEANMMFAKPFFSKACRTADTVTN